MIVIERFSAQGEVCVTTMLDCTETIVIERFATQPKNTFAC